MKPSIKNAVLVVSALLIVGSIGAFVGTGMYPYTRFRDKEIEQANAENGLADLFADTTESQALAPKVESVNAIGLLPSGPGAASLSVATLSGPALVAIVGVLWWTRRGSAAGGDEPAPAGH